MPLVNGGAAHRRRSGASPQSTEERDAEQSAISARTSRTHAANWKGWRRELHYERGSTFTREFLPAMSRATLLYIIMLAVCAAGLWVILGFGANLTPPV